MQSLLLVKADSSSFEPSEVEQVFRSDSRFRDLRVNTSSGDVIACKFVDSENWTLISLGTERECISVSYTGRAALQAALAIQRGLSYPLRAFDSSYTFDLTFFDISTVEELEAAIENARTS